MKLIIVDIYGDGDQLTAVEDTPKAREEIEAFREHDRKVCSGELPEEDGQYFTPFLEQRGVRVFESETVAL